MIKNYAIIQDGEVVNVIVADAEFIEQYLTENKNFEARETTTASRGYMYDKDNDKFIRPKPSKTHTFNSTTFDWDPPAKPTRNPASGKQLIFNNNMEDWEEVQTIR